MQFVHGHALEEDGLARLERLQFGGLGEIGEMLVRDSREKRDMTCKEGLGVHT